MAGLAELAHGDGRRDAEMHAAVVVRHDVAGIQQRAKRLLRLGGAQHLPWPFTETTKQKQKNKRKRTERRREKGERGP